MESCGLFLGLCTSVMRFIILFHVSVACSFYLLSIFHCRSTWKFTFTTIFWWRAISSLELLRIRWLWAFLYKHCCKQMLSFLSVKTQREGLLACLRDLFAKYCQILLKSFPKCLYRLHSSENYMTVLFASNPC